MNSLKTTLWISAIGCLLATPFVIIPWDIVKSIFLWFGIGTISSDPVTIYFFRIICIISGLIGVFFIILAKNPIQYGYMLNLAAYGLMLFGLLSLMLGLGLDMPLKLYIGDSLFGLILGIRIAMLSNTIFKK